MTMQYNFYNELQRKGLHLLALVIPWGMLQLQTCPALLVLGLIAALGLGLDLGRAYLQPVARLVSRLGRTFMRPEEHPGSDCKGQIVLTGSTWILISAFCLLLLFPADTASLALALFLLGDAAAGLLGKRFGRISWRISKRTVEGSLAFLAAALLLAWLWPVNIQPWIAVAAAVCACLVEVLPGPLNDNLQVPLATALLISILDSLP
ncbi:MAG: hypothetical protein ACOC43_09340 [Desulfohalobiaceae bacterium]